MHKTIDAEIIDIFGYIAIRNVRVYIDPKYHRAYNIV